VPPAALTLREIVARLGGDAGGDGDTRITGIGTLDSAGPSDLTFLANPRYRGRLAPTRAGAVILSRADRDAATIPCIVADNPYAYYARAVALFHPESEAKPGIHPFAQIVRICSSYDAMTAPRSDRPAMLPDQALKAMIEAKPGTYDPLLLTVFTNMMGLFPTGTTVTLSTGEVAVVVHPNPEQPRRPLVAVVRGRDGQAVDGDFLDLALKGETGAYPSAITGSVDPAELGIKIPEYLLA
jgi:hypothetical protein